VKEHTFACCGGDEAKKGVPHAVNDAELSWIGWVAERLAKLY